MILLIDNYDSFVFNLARYIQELGISFEVVRNDAVSLAQVRDLDPQGILLSPGPCTPNEAGICVDLVRELRGITPILGVCLGHQAIVAAYGGNVIRAPHPMHGRTSLIEHRETALFRGLPNPFLAGRYHSLLAEAETLPSGLEVTARTVEDHLIMAVEDRTAQVFGVQFHPESILTEGGHQLLHNFLCSCGLSPSSYLSRELTLGVPPSDSTGGSALDPQPSYW